MIDKNTIPQHWEVKKLGEVCELITKGTTPTSVGFNFTDQGVKFIKVESLSETGKIIPKKVAYINEECHQALKRSQLKTNDILFSIAGALGRTGIVEEKILPANTNQALAIIRLSPNAKVSNSFLTKYFESENVVRQIAKLKGGVAQQNLSLGHLNALEIILPPFSEQQELVAKIEELFSELDKGKEQLETARQQLKVYRQAVLKWAFEGRFTNAEVKEGELPEGWILTKINEVSKRIFDGPFGSNLKTKDYITEGVRVIRLENIGPLEFRDEYKSFVSEEKYETIINHTVSAGDIIFSSFIIGDIRVVVLPKSIQKAINKSDCFCIRANTDIANEHFLAYFLSTKQVYNQLVNQVHGATRPRINTTQLKSCIIPLPPIEEQNQIVQEIESRLSVCDKVEETISKSLQQAETLRQSILKQAFEGKLLTTGIAKTTTIEQLQKQASKVGQFQISFGQ